VILAIIATILLVPAILLSILLGVATNFFTARVPTGPDAMGLIGPIAALGVIWFCTMVAGWCAVGGHGFDWVSSRPLVPTVVVTMLILGVGLAAVGGFSLWLERFSAAGGLGTLLSVGAPVALHVFLLVCVWKGRQSGTEQWGKYALLAFSPVVLAGLAFAVLYMWKSAGVAAENARRAAAEAMAVQQEDERRAALTPAQKLTEDLAKLSPESPLWPVAGYLLDHQDAECRKIVVKRARQCPNLDDDVRGTLDAQWASIRGIGIEFVIADDARRDSWIPFVANAIDKLSAQIEAANSLENESSQERISVEVERAFRVGRVFGGTHLEPSLTRLRAAVEACPAGEKRERALAAIEAMSAG
jgi:hypothetical protein